MIELHVKSQLTGHVATFKGQMRNDLFYCEDGKIFAFAEDDTILLHGSYNEFHATSEKKEWRKRNVPYVFDEAPRLGRPIM